MTNCSSVAFGSTTWGGDTFYPGAYPGGTSYPTGDFFPPVYTSNICQKCWTSPCACCKCHCRHCCNCNVFTVQGPPYRCPVCEGRGHVPYGFYTGLTESTGAPQPEQCKTCAGRGMVWW